MMALIGLQRGAEITNILQGVARRHNMTLATMRENCREQRLVQARREAARELRRSGLSLARIGRLLGGLHHTTVIHYLGPEPRKVVPEAGPMFPDYSGEWAI